MQLINKSSMMNINTKKLAFISIFTLMFLSNICQSKSYNVNAKCGACTNMPTCPANTCIYYNGGPIHNYFVACGQTQQVCEQVASISFKVSDSGCPSGCNTCCVTSQGQTPQCLPSVLGFCVFPGLSTGAIVGISIGSVIAAGIIIGVIVYFVRRNKNK